jgi:hypothetical protein
MSARTFANRMIERVSRADTAAQLREQAASFRRLAKRARTPSGSTALATVAEQFDKDARRIDPLSELVEK